MNIEHKKLNIINQQFDDTETGKNKYQLYVLDKIKKGQQAVIAGNNHY